MSLKEFQIISKLGEGTYSSVWLAKRISDGEEYAIKKVKLTTLSEKEKQNSLNEVRLLASIDNPFIIGFKEVFFEDNQTLCIVMEFAAGGDMHSLMHNHQRSRILIKEKDIWRYSLQMILGLKALHDRKVLHRDLKCANIFLSKDGKVAKLGDLNVSKVAKDHLVYTQTGTPYYASPEVWRDEPYDVKSDIWSLGCVIYETCALKPPFRANDMQELFKKVQKGNFEKIPSVYSEDLNTLVSLCLQVSTSKRPTCDKLLQHPVIKKNCQGLLYNPDGMEDSPDLLKTIKIPMNAKNLRSVGIQLPKPNYNQAKSMKFDTDFPYKKAHSQPTEGEPEEYRKKPIKAQKSYKTEQADQDASFDGQEPKETEQSLIIASPSSRTQRRHQTYDNNDDVVQTKQSKENHKAKISIKRIVNGSKASPEVTVKKVKRLLEELPKDRRSVEVRLEVKRGGSHRDSHEYEERNSILEDRKRYMVKKYLAKEIGDESSRNKDYSGVKGASVGVSVGHAGQHAIKNLSNIEKTHVEKAYGGRIEAIDRRAQNLIKKYHHEVEVLRKSEDLNRKSSIENRGKEDYKDIYDKNNKRSVQSRQAGMEAYESHNVNIVRHSGSNSRERSQNSREVHHRKKMDEIDDVERAKNLRDKVQLRGVQRPNWWG